MRNADSGEGGRGVSGGNGGICGWKLESAADPRIMM
jgi:hypothetical protein